MKKLIAAALTAAMLFSSAVFVSSAAGSVKYGDADKNGEITLADVSCVMKHIARWDIEIDTAAADVDTDGKITLGDAVLLLRYIAGWEDVTLGDGDGSFPGEDDGWTGYY